jgi:hypothetical protein
MSKKIYIVAVPLLLKANGQPVQYGTEVTSDDITDINKREEEGYVMPKADFLKEQKEAEAEVEEEKERLEKEQSEKQKGSDEPLAPVDPAAAKEQKETLDNIIAAKADDKPADPKTPKKLI